MTLCCVTNSWWCSGKMLGLFLPATLWANWKVLYGNTWSLATGLTLSWKGVGIQQGFVLVSEFLMLLESWIPVLV